MKASWLVVLALAGCGRDAAAPPDDDAPGWHVQKIAECGFSVLVPGPADRSERTLDGGWRSILYVVRADQDMYIIGCDLMPPTGTWTPAEALRAQVANHNSPIELGGTGVAVTDEGMKDAADGGSYWFAFENGMRIEGRVHVVGRQIEDLSGSVAPGSARSRAALERVLGSYRRP